MAAPAQDPVYLAALEWLARLNDEDATEQDRRAFASWLDADSAHPAAYARAQALWNRFDAVRPAVDRMHRRLSLIHIWCIHLMSAPFSNNWRAMITRMISLVPSSI